MSPFVPPPMRRLREQVSTYRDAWDASNRVALERGGPWWVVLGDSLSQGIGASAWDNGWVHRSWSDLRQQGAADDLTVVNLSRSGATTHDVLDRQLDALESLRRQEADVRLVSLLAGANDFVVRGGSRGLDDRLAAIVGRLHSHSVVTYLPQPFRVARRANAVLDQAAGRGDVLPVSIRRAGFLWPGNRAGDLFHPNDRGHRLLGSAMTPALLSALRRHAEDA